MRKHLLSLACAVLLGAPASAYTITLNGFDTSYMSTFADDQAGGSASEIVNPAALPYSSTSSSVDGGTSTVAGYDLSNSSFDITFDHSRDSSSASFAQSFGYIYFSADEGIDYSAAGSYAADDPDGRRVVLRAYLRDITAGGSGLFNSAQESQSTPDEMFTVGLSEGDVANTNTGSLTGTLIAGHDSLFFYGAWIQTYPTASTFGATGSGSVSLTFVPEPSAASLLGLGLVSIASVRRRRWATPAST